MSRILITPDGYIRPDPEVEYSHDERTGRTVVSNETHFSPFRLIMAYDPDTGLLYGGASEDEAMGVTDDDEDNNPVSTPDPSPAPVPSPAPDPSPAPEVDWEAQAAAAGWSAPASDSSTTTTTEPTPIGDSIPQPSGE